jgi:hypothetical protein
MLDVGATSMSSARPGRSTARRALLLLVALTLALGVPWMRRSVAEPEPSAAAPASTPAQARDAHVQDAARELERTPIEVARAEDEASASRREEATAVARESVDVLVLDAHALTPVAGAEVRWLNSAELGLPLHPTEYGVRYDPAIIVRRVDPPLPREGSRLATTDEQGIAHVDTRVFPGRVSAILGDRSGSVDVGDRVAGLIRVYVTEQHVIPIQVVDGAGVPVPGVPVSLRESPTVDNSAELWLGRTNGSGLVRAELAKPRNPASVGRTVHACLEIPLDRSVSAAVDLCDPPTEPVRLVLPPCGSVAVGVREAGGRTAHRFNVRLRCTPSETRMAANELDRTAHAFEPVDVQGEEARFPFVGLGLRVYLSASRSNDFTRWTRAAVSAAGERRGSAVPGTTPTELGGNPVG